jgi:hypothetical protein
MDPIGNTSVSIVVVQLLQLPSNRLDNTVYNRNSIVVEAYLPLFVQRSLPSNGYIHHNIFSTLFAKRLVVSDGMCIYL